MAALNPRNKQQRSAAVAMVVMVAWMLGTPIVHCNIVSVVAGDFMAMIGIDRDLAERRMDMFVSGGVLKLVERT